MLPEGRDAAHVWDMLHYSRVLTRIVQGRAFDDYLRDETLRLAVERGVEVIGEAARRVSKKTKSVHTQVPWRAIMAQRQVLAHEYDTLRHQSIWRVATVHVPALISLLQPLVPIPTPRVCVMISGGGRTLINLLDHIERGSLKAKVAVVIASDGACAGVERARARRVPVLVMPGVIPGEVLERTLREHHIDFVVLAGYLKLVNIPRGYEGRVVNIHPALLPKFGGKGMHGRRVHGAVLAAGERVSGCTVHLCDGEYDTGRILLQKTCPVMAGDTPDTLAARVFEVEKAAYPEALSRLFAEPWGVVGG
jgi:formyltetrahydrofolate-dependent phosphoribosylglycinamide formyltransferase